MALMPGELYDALVAGGTPPDKAREAAEEATTFEGRFAGIGTRLSVLTWMAGALVVLALSQQGLAQHHDAAAGAVNDRDRQRQHEHEWQDFLMVGLIEPPAASRRP